ncbi:chemotaxis protein CheB [Natronoflexus pectinivorans]|uniref:protein-glutamate methylesterase n=1 Tax=Natronoflexus pectinivorans TaxID=682526 RepID=A0A4R2GNQ9_9BACT|nr:chemotaxis protein CheB [Natronoflexus pectinivorans]TCO10945.1 two-component system chemotaxis response regulator CheB [Natronoflexus pectinivorans]
MHNPEHSYKIIVMGGSAGSFSVVSGILSKLDPNFKIPIILSLHRLKHVRSGLSEGLSLNSKIKVVEPNDKEKIEPNRVYLAPSNYHMFIEIDGSIALSTEESHNHSRPSIDYTLMSAAYVYREKALGILLTGANKDGAKGLKSIADNRGYTIVQDPVTCDIDTMPKSALQLFCPDEILSPSEIVQFLNSLQP